MLKDAKSTVAYSKKSHKVVTLKYPEYLFSHEVLLLLPKAYPYVVLFKGQFPHKNISKFARELSFPIFRHSDSFGLGEKDGAVDIGRKWVYPIINEMV